MNWLGPSLNHAAHLQIERRAWGFRSGLSWATCWSLAAGKDQTLLRETLHGSRRSPELQEAGGCGYEISQGPTGSTAFSGEELKGALDRRSHAMKQLSKNGSHCNGMRDAGQRGAYLLRETTLVPGSVAGRNFALGLGHPKKPNLN